jgi:hypothetical protein
MRLAGFLKIIASFGVLALCACVPNPLAVPPATSTSSANAPRTLAPTILPPATSAPYPPAPPVATEPIAPTPLGPAPTGPAGAATQTVTLSDSGRTINLQVGERFLLSLGDTLNWSLQVDDPGILSRVPNILTVRGSQGLFEAHRAGRTKLTATGDPACRKAQPACMLPSLFFQLQIVVTAGPPATSTAQGTVTYADNGRTITLHVGDRFLLMLQDIYHWDVSVGDPTIVSRDANIMVAKGQGIYQANRPGETTLSATGTVVCPPQQACPMLAIGFQVHIVVQ